MKRNIDTYSYSVLNDARKILMTIGMPEKLYNPRCVMTLCACAEVFDSKKWRHASESYHGTHDIIHLINLHFPNKAGLDSKGYAENSRETFRDETLKEFVRAGLMEMIYGLSSNDRNSSYRFTAKFASLLRTYHTSRWTEELAVFLSTNGKYAEKLKQAKTLDPGYSFQYQDITLKLDRSSHNKLQLKVLSEFVPFFVPDAQLLYIGDTSHRILWRDDAALARLRIRILSESTKLPDIILFSEEKNLVLFVEAFSSTGEMSLGRVQEISEFCDKPAKWDVAFITAFETQKKMLQVFPRISWETDIWVAENPSHLIHKDGNKFIGRPLQ